MTKKHEHIPLFPETPRNGLQAESSQAVQKTVAVTRRSIFDCLGEEFLTSQELESAEIDTSKSLIPDSERQTDACKEYDDTQDVEQAKERFYRAVRAIAFNSARKLGEDYLPFAVKKAFDTVIARRTYVSFEGVLRDWSVTLLEQITKEVRADLKKKH